MNTDILAAGSGGIVGLTLGLVGGGGSILAVPLLAYVVGVASPHIAIGTSAIAVSASALANLVTHWRAGNVKWPCAIAFATSGVIGAFAGSSVAKAIDGQKLMALFGLLTLAVGATMLLRRGGSGDPTVRLSMATARHLLPMLVGIGFGVGLLSGFFGIGGGFLIVPGLMLSTGMPLAFAIGTSLVAVTAFGAASATSYALSGMIDWRVAAAFISGGVGGGFAGIALGSLLANRGQTLALVFAVVIIGVGLYIVGRGILVLV